MTPQQKIVIKWQIKLVKRGEKCHLSNTGVHYDYRMQELCTWIKVGCAFKICYQNYSQQIWASFSGFRSASLREFTSDQQVFIKYTTVDLGTKASYFTVLLSFPGINYPSCVGAKQVQQVSSSLLQWKQSCAWWPNHAYQDI